MQTNISTLSDCYFFNGNIFVHALKRGEKNDYELAYMYVYIYMYICMYWKCMCNTTSAIHLRWKHVFSRRVAGKFCDAQIGGRLGLSRSRKMLPTPWFRDEEKGGGMHMLKECFQCFRVTELPVVSACALINDMRLPFFLQFRYYLCDSFFFLFIFEYTTD